jgi:hypothetical protein
MEIRPFKWITIKYKNDLFDVKWSPIDQKIKEIRSIDSEINIASLLSLEVTREIQDIIINKGTHHAI